jgi:hypothetical protein
MKEQPEGHSREGDRLIYAGLLGLAGASVLQLSDQHDLTTGQFVAVYAFAGAIPLLAVGLITDYARRAGSPVPQWRGAVGILGALGAVVGFGALFFHFGIVAGTLFAAAVVLGPPG